MNMKLEHPLPPRFAELVERRFAIAVRDLVAALGGHELWLVETGQCDARYLYDPVGMLLWSMLESGRIDSAAGASEYLRQLPAAGAYRWDVPTEVQFRTFAKIRKNPLRNGPADRLFDQCYWGVMEGRVDLDGPAFTPGAKYPVKLLPCAAVGTGADFLREAHELGWKLTPVGSKVTEDLLNALKAPQLFLAACVDLDHQSCRLPRLEPAQFTDVNKGMWEFCGIDTEALPVKGLRARNPADDIRSWNIAIDFGTSSTVVAYDDNGQHKLLRVGVEDLSKEVRPEHYENPTVLEFVDFCAMLRDWQAYAYRPHVRWADIRCSHEALHNLRNNETDPAVVSSILGKIKQWALRGGNDKPLRVTDRCGFEHELLPMAPLNPVSGQALEVGPENRFDPVELYAWFLGMTINWRSRGLFLRYFMTFPVAYPREVKENILASFRRGLQRSLPEALLKQPELLRQFSVKELASEPAAYAAAAMPHLGIAPTTEGLAYAVFDFGGGTTDFDFGFFRLPTPEEEDDGSEMVFEHFGSQGDRFLGGENLLENLAYRTFRHNLDVCRRNRIAFSRPLDAEDFAGSEMLLEKTQAAVTNSLMLMSRLRPLWESGKLDNASGVESIELLDREGRKVKCELAIPVAELNQYLEDRIEQGIRNFYFAMKEAFSDKPPAEVHVLLAGNASRSARVSAFFGLDAATLSPEGTDAVPAGVDVSAYIRSVVITREGMDGEQAQAGAPSALTPQERMREFRQSLFGASGPEVVVHPPLAVDEDNLFRPTAKTGVALGLLRLCPGGVIDVVNHATRSSGDQAPFSHYVGRTRQARFQSALKPGCAYGEWHELGPVRDGVFSLYHSQSPKALSGEMVEGEVGLFKQALHLAVDDRSKKRVFVRAVGPAEIEYCTAGSAEEVAAGSLENLARMSLA